MDDPGVPGLHSSFQPLFPMTPPIPHPIEALSDGRFGGMMTDRDKRFLEILKPQGETIPKHFPLNLNKHDSFPPGMELLYPTRKKLQHSPEPSPTNDNNEDEPKRRRYNSPRPMDNDIMPSSLQRPEPMVYGKIIGDNPHLLHHGSGPPSLGAPPLYAVVGDMSQGLHNPAQFADMFMPPHYTVGEGVGGF